MNTASPLPDFSNTEIAFRPKGNQSLRRAVFLFEVLKYDRLVAFSKGLIRVAFRFRLPIGFILKPLIFNHFCGGETLKGCLPVVKSLDSTGVGVIPDFSVEGKSDEAAFERVKDEVMAAIALAAENRAVTFAVFKPTGLAPFSLWEQLSCDDWEKTQTSVDYLALKTRLDSIFGMAAAKKVPVLIDAEETWIQPGIDRIVRYYSRNCNKERVIVYNTAQMYRTDRLAFLQQELDLADAGGYLLGYKLVRGAYHEQEVERAMQLGLPVPVYTQKSDTDGAFNRALNFCFTHRERVAMCLATHNEESTLLLVHLLREAGDPTGQPISFAQLYGMSDHITFNLAAAGYPVSKYLPYGPLREVIPYLFRRAEENRSVDGQTGRELLNLKKEQARRREALR
jgi:proline dehydrogenase